MGVLGFVPFLQKTFPQTIRTLPARFKELGGRTLVFDGTLITQRLHYSPLPHPYRHILGWYRMIKELKECNVTAICIFDGKQRTSAKKRENDRRREVKKVDAARGSIESDRLRRLRKLTSLLEVCKSLPEADQERATKAFRDLITDYKAPLLIPGAAFKDSGTPPSEQVEYIFEDDSWGDLHETDVAEALSLSSDATSLPALFSELAVDDDSVRPLPYTLDLEPEVRQPVDEEANTDSAALQSMDPDELSSALAELYHDYQESIPQLTILPQPTSTEPEDATVIYAMSKLQHELAVDEGRVWDDIDGMMTANGENDLPASNLQVLEERSSYMSQSYDRRNNPPTAETYAECRLILEAMGVPCIEATGPYEAEAVASSIVVNGYGDYVVSEDSDVLVYEAPLLRNVTSRRDPLIVISGSEVRAALALDRANYLDFILLLGTDFSQRIKNVGPQRALKFVREHGSIERIVEQETKYPPRLPLPSYLEQIDAARLVFETLPPVPDLKALEQKEMDEDSVADILEQFGLHKLITAKPDDNLMGSNYFGDSP